MSVVASSPLRATESGASVAARCGYVLTVAAIGWGAFAFGAVYPWAYWPLAAAAQIAGFLGVMAERRARLGMSRAMGIALIVLAAAPLVQLVPLPRASLETISPATAEMLDLTFASTGSHALSIDPSATSTAAALFASFALLLAGTSRLASRIGATGLIYAVTVIGVLLALTGIVQKPLFTGRIYGFWVPEFGSSPFGPFVNKNHFAGWMLMAIPLALGLLMAGLTREIRGVRPQWRARVLWLSSPAASRLVLIAGAVLLMALSLVLTMSRSGIAALALSLVLTAWLVVRTRVSPRHAGLAVVAVVTVLLVAWVGADVISARFAAAEWGDLNARRGAWADAWAIAARFPLFGAGLNSYGTATLFHQQHDLTVHYVEAHNDYLQLAAEGGLLLALPAAGCIALFVRDVRRRLREDEGSSAYWIRAGAVTAVASIALQETVDFSLQMPGNAALFAVVCGIALHKAGRTRPV